ncbi:MAG: aldehyde-activating protein [Robiginitomaculum sp.]|nr:MAG: aldehyde-activating protein [Robiginitomaculum sp.]
MVKASNISWREGACHCGAVCFAVSLPDDIVASECNCSICAKTGFLHLIVPKDRFDLRTGEESLTDYRFNTGTARHLFCKTCGVKAFYVPRSNPDGWSVNLRCLNAEDFKSITIEPFDGQNWEANADALVHLA